jgi:hypothetical protein
MATVTTYPNQNASYTDDVGNTASLTPGVGLVLSNGVTSLTTNQTGFTNGVQTLTFVDLFATVAKTDAIQYATSTATTLNVQDTILVDKIGDTHQTHIDNTQVHILDTATLDEMFIDHNSLILVQPSTTHQTELLGNMLNFQTPEDLVSCGHTTYQDGRAGFEAYDLLTGDNNLLTTDTLYLNNVTLGVNNTLDADKWTGNIQTVNTVANATHYLNFSDSSATGYGKPQKTAGISCNPSTNTITTTTFSGSLSGNSSSASSVAITSDNTAGTYFLPFCKTLSTNSPLFADNVTGPLTYDPSVGVLTALYHSGDIIIPTSQNTATYAGTTLSISGASNGQNVSFRSSSITITGGSNSVTALTLTGMVVGGRYRCGILNNGSGNLTFQTGLGSNIKTFYSSNVQIPTGRYGFMSIDCISINAVTTYCIQVTLLTN